MKFRPLVIAAAAALTSEIGVACEADRQAMRESSLPPVVHSISKDNLPLTSAQRRMAWESISRHGTIQFAPSSFTPSIGVKLPANMTLRMLPAEAAAHVPGLRPYDYALLQNKLLIVNPQDRKILAVIDRHN